MPSKDPNHKKTQEGEMETTKTILQIQEGENFAGIPAELDIETLLERAKLDYTRTIDEPPVALTVDDVPFGSLGGFSVITGKAKSKKTFLATMIMAGFLNPNIRNNAFAGLTKKDKNRVVFVDTEQANHDCHKVANRVIAMAGSEAKIHFDVYTLREFSFEQNLQMIDQLLNKTKDIGLLVIDGARDLIAGINDDKESSFIARKFLQWSTIHDIHIVTVIHQNKGDSNARGHLGSELINKAETVVAVVSTKKDGVSIVNATHCRGVEFNSFAFEINMEELPQVIENYKTTKSGRKKVTPENLEVSDHKKILAELRDIVLDTKPSYNDLVIHLKSILEKMNYPSGVNKSKEFIKHYETVGYINKEGTSKSPNAYYLIAQV